jgi:GntR family transcriptional repressor for pyruvate dehydrogenase complex
VFKPTIQGSVVDAIRQQIWSRIVEGGLKAGAKLPAEKELLQELKVSRPALREALHKLVGEGILDTRHGQGTFVRVPTAGSAIQGGVVSLLLISDAVREIQEVRSVLEPNLAMWAAERASDDQLNALEEFLTECDKAEDVTFDAGWEFHRRLASAAGNSAMAKIADVLYEMIRVYQQHFYDVHFHPRQDLHDHFELLAAIKKRDPELARDAMLTHIFIADEILESMLNGQQPTGSGDQTATSDE